MSDRNEVKDMQRKHSSTASRPLPVISRQRDQPAEMRSSVEALASRTSMKCICRRFFCFTPRSRANRLERCGSFQGWGGIEANAEHAGLCASVRTQLAGGSWCFTRNNLRTALFYSGGWWLQSWDASTLVMHNVEFFDWPTLIHTYADWFVVELMKEKNPMFPLLLFRKFLCSSGWQLCV